MMAVVPWGAVFCFFVELMMSFGFPAFHTENFSVAGREDLPRLCADVAVRMRWTVKVQQRDRVVFSTKVNLFSWGERVTVEYLPGSTLRVTSRCAMPTQCLDWGRNQRNVQAFLAALQMALGSQGAV